MANHELTADRLRELLDYDPETGVFVWRVDRGGTAMAGSLAGRTNSKGYCQIGIGGRRYAAHRVAWLYINGEWPKTQIDHINGVKHDNRIANLRDVPQSLNQKNRHRARKDSKTGVLGVCWHKAGGKWAAQKYGRYLGLFPTIEAAKSAWDAA